MTSYLEQHETGRHSLAQRTRGIRRRTWLGGHDATGRAEMALMALMACLGSQPIGWVVLGDGWSWGSLRVCLLKFGALLLPCVAPRGVSHVSCHVISKGVEGSHARLEWIWGSIRACCRPPLEALHSGLPFEVDFHSSCLSVGTDYVGRCMSGLCVGSPDCLHLTPRMGFLKREFMGPVTIPSLPREAAGPSVTQRDPTSK